ncbi:cupredoxin domain-containing protein [Leptothrix sp. BB-4]
MSDRRHTRHTRRSLFNRLTASAMAAFALLGAGAVSAADVEVQLVIRDHRFEPEELKVPAGQRIKILVDNQDATPEEFESSSLKREKVIPGKSKGQVLVGPLKPGRYKFVGEFHEATAKGVLVVE